MKKRIPPKLDFHERLVILRKERGLTRQAPAELGAMHIRRYESGQNVICSVTESIVLRNTFKTAERRFTEGGSTR